MSIRKVMSNQLGIHDGLQKVVEKHLTTTFRKPPALHTLKVFDAVKDRVEKHPNELIFDSGCGTAQSTRYIAECFPEALVIGIDRSSHRLSKQGVGSLPRNAITLQADLVDFWRLACQANWKLRRHYILYPNPYPKSVHLKRRWHGHPVFPELLQLGGVIELRSNWKVYVDEFVIAAHLAGQRNIIHETFVPEQHWTLFEKKYHEDGQVLYRCLLNS